MFWNVTIVMGVVALIQCQPLNVAHEKRWTMENNETTESETGTLDSQGAPAVLVLNSDYNANPGNSILDDKLVLIVPQTAVHERERRIKRGVDSMVASKLAAKGTGVFATGLGFLYLGYFLGDAVFSKRSPPSRAN